MTVRLENISKIYPLKTVLASVNAEFNEGKIHAVVGENGAGKTTLADIISGTRQPTIGKIFINGKKVQLSSRRESARFGIQIVNQRPLVAEGITVKENILLGFEHCKEYCNERLPTDKKEVSREIETTRKKWAPELALNAEAADIGADGRFYTALISAIVKKPQVLILDEPSAMLDWEQRRLLYANIRSLAQSGTNIIIITHSLQEAALFTDTVTVLKEGQVCAYYPDSRKFVKGAEGYNDFEIHPSDYRQDLNHSKNGRMVFGNISVRPEKRPALFDVGFSFESGSITLIRGLQEDGLGTLENVVTGMETSRYTGSLEITTPSFKKKINNPAASSGVCCSQKVSQSGFNTLLLRPKGRGIKPSARINFEKKQLTASFLRGKDSCRTGIVPSGKNSRGSNPNLTVTAMLTTYYNGRNSEQYAERLIKKAGVNISPNESVANLSGGMLQKLILARELENNPDFLIICEPIQGLDTESASLLCKKLYDTAQNGTGILILSATEFPEEYCSSILKLESGKLIGEHTETKASSMNIQTETKAAETTSAETINPKKGNYRSLQPSPEPVQEHAAPGHAIDKKEKQSAHSSQRKHHIIVESLNGFVAILTGIVAAVMILFFFSTDKAGAAADFIFGTFTSKYYLGIFLNTAMIYLAAGLGAAVSIKSGYFNLGGEGQIYAGGFVTAIVLNSLETLPGPIGILAALTAAIFTGSALTLVSAVLKHIKNASVLLTSFLVSAAVIPAVDALIAGPFRDTTGNLLATPFIAEKFRFDQIFPPSPFNISFIFILAVTLITWYIMKKTVPGRHLEIMGKAPEFARYSGYSETKITYSALAASGALHGVAGFLAVCGTYYTCHSGFYINMGWNAFSCALIANAEPIPLIPASLILSWLYTSSGRISLVQNFGFDMGTLIQGIVLFFISAKLISGKLHPVKRFQDIAAKCKNTARRQNKIHTGKAL